MATLTLRPWASFILSPACSAPSTPFSLDQRCSYFLEPPSEDDEMHRAPVEMLPLEMLSEIFCHCLDHSETYMSPHRNRAPLLLTRVCRSWRRCAITTPALWTSLRLYSPFTEHQYRSLVSLADLWLQRSGARPLSLSLTIPDHHSLPASLLSHLPRCARLHLAAPDPFSAALGDNMPLLESLSLTSPNDHAFYPKESTFPLDISAPRLRALALDGFPHRLVLPWAQLTHLRVANWEPTKPWLSLLRECSALTSCSLSPAGEILLVGGAPTPIVFPALESLRVHPTRVLGFVRVLEHFAAPNLKHLDVAVPGNIVPLCREVAPLLARSQCQLQSLALAGLRLDAFEDFRALCALVPNLTRLSVAGIGRMSFPSRMFFDEMTRKEGRGCLLPKLEALEMRLSVGKTDFPDDAIEEMLRSRIAGQHSGCSRMRSADVYVHRRIHDWIASLVDQGTHWYISEEGEVVQQRLEAGER